MDDPVGRQRACEPLGKTKRRGSPARLMKPFISEDVHPALTEQFAKPGVEPFVIDVAVPLDGDRTHLVVVLVLCGPRCARPPA